MVTLQRGLRAGFPWRNSGDGWNFLGPEPRCEIGTTPLGAWGLSCPGTPWRIGSWTPQRRAGAGGQRGKDPQVVVVVDDAKPQPRRLRR